MYAFNPNAFSYSSLKTYESCPRKFAEVNVYRNFQDVFTSPKGDYGDRMHKAAEAYVKAAGELEAEFKFIKPILDTLRNISGEKRTEHKMGVKHDGTPTRWNDPGRWFQGIADLTIVGDSPVARVVDYKGLDTETEIPTPNGFVRMGDLQIGDFVYGTDGLAYPVTGKSIIKNIGCYEVKFTNQAKVICDEEHLWELVDGSVVCVQELKPRARIVLSDAVEYPEKQLPLDPYVLGFWLADGKQSSGEVTKGDAFMWEEVVRLGFALGKNTDHRATLCETKTIKGIVGTLKELALICNKHIPDIYKHSSINQRLRLVRGLMDGDGSCNKVRKQAIFTCTRKRLSDDLREVLESLGLRVSQAQAKYSGFGVEGVQYPLSFRPRGFNPFLTPRKANIAESFFGGREYLEIESVTETVSRPTQCISVDSPNNMYLCTRSFIPTHNTGDSKYADTDQLELMSLLIFAHYPHVKLVKGVLLFVLSEQVRKRTVDITEKDRLWQKYRERHAKVIASHAADNWPMKESGLCKKHCVVTSCAHNGRR